MSESHYHCNISDFQLARGGKKSGGVVKDIQSSTKVLTGKEIADLLRSYRDNGYQITVTILARRDVREAIAKIKYPLPEDIGLAHDHQGPKDSDE